jgi:hypothetical protein
MQRDDYVQLVEYLEDRFGIGAMDAWANAAKVYPDFEPLDSDSVWEALLAKLDLGPEFPPKPPALRAAALERMRHKPRQALPETTERWSWEEFSKRTYGKVIPLMEAVCARAEEIER